VKMVVGGFVVRDIPVKTTVQVQGMFPFEDLNVRLVGGLDVLSATREGVHLFASAQVDNPMEVEGSVPYLNVRMLYEG
jgi:hypothetical protein